MWYNVCWTERNNENLSLLTFMVHFSVVVYCKSLKLCQPMFILLVRLYTLAAILPIAQTNFSRLPLVYVCLEVVCECVNP